MFGGSVRDRIKAAEAIDGGSKHHHSHTHRRGHKLSLKTDEHIKEEFLRRGDGGWSKKVDIGQQQAYTPQPDVPFIKLTLETPIVENSDPKIPGKLSKSVSGTFETISEDQEAEPAESSSSKQPEQISEKTEDAPPPVEPRKDTVPKDESAVPSIDPSKRECHPEYAEDTMSRPSKSVDGRRKSKSKSRQAHVEDCDESVILEPTEHGEEHVEFSTVDWSGSHSPSRASSKKHRKHSSHRMERVVAEEAVVDDLHRSRSRSSRSKSASREHHDDADHEQHHHHHHHHRSRDETPSAPRIRKSSSRSGSTHRHSSAAQHSPPTSARRSTNSLWPSFSQTERVSMSDVLETGSMRSKSPRPRPTSFHSTSSVRSEMSTKTVEFAEYFAGQKLDHVPHSPPSPQLKTRPLGFVRSKSSTGEYTEHYTRDKTMLRKPDEDELLEPTEEHKVRKERQSFHEGHEKKKPHDTPWQVKLFQEIAKH